MKSLSAADHARRQKEDFAVLSLLRSYHVMIAHGACPGTSRGYVAVAWAVGTIGCQWANERLFVGGRCAKFMLHRARWPLPTVAKQRQAGD